MIHAVAHLRRIALACALALFVFFPGCSDDSTGPGGGGTPAEDFSGAWDVDLEIIARRVCQAEVGEQFPGEFFIAQEGNSASLLLQGMVPIDLTVNGSTASGSTTRGFQTWNVALTKMENGDLEGTIDYTYDAPGDPTNCTEAASLAATPAAATTPSDFGGHWDLELETGSTTCGGEEPGESESVCRTVVQSGSDVSISDPDGDIRGVVIGDRALLWRLNDEESLVIDIALSSSEVGRFSGIVSATDLQDDCMTQIFIDGVDRGQACPELPEPDDFAGSWILVRESYRNSGCPSDDADDLLASCIDVTVSGSAITVDDNTGRGLLTGSIEEDRAVVSRAAVGGEFTMELYLDDDGLEIAVERSYDDPPCFEALNEIEYSAFSSPVSCDTPSDGPFAGFWATNGSLIEADCEEFPFIGAGCTEVLQFGNVVVFPEAGFIGTVVGNTLTISEVEEGENFRFTLDIELLLSGDGNSFTGTWEFGFEDFATPSENCSASFSITGQRTTGCDQFGAADVSWWPAGLR